MKTPICDFVSAYAAADPLRLHMPGHKGVPVLGAEPLDITEVPGADVLYDARGVIAESEGIAAGLFGSGRTLYACEGSSLAVRAMLYLALLADGGGGARPLVLAGRNAHRSFLSAAALLDFDVEWLRPQPADSRLTCRVTPDALDARLAALPRRPAAVYVTSPDYLGHMVDVAGLSAVCRRYGVPLLVDNAHGAYLRFLPADAHPMTLGADMCCDSAHKTLPVLTGGAYLHISASAPPLFPRRCAGSVFAPFPSCQAGESHIVQTLGISDPFRPKGELEAHHLVFIIACQMDDRFRETVDVLDRVVTAPHTAHLMAAVLDEVGIQRTARGHNHPVAVFERLHQLVFAVVAPPHDDSLVGRDTGIDHLVPADHRLALGSHDIGSTADKILFQARFVA